MGAKIKYSSDGQDTSYNLKIHFFAFLVVSSIFPQGVIPLVIFCLSFSQSRLLPAQTEILNNKNLTKSRLHENEIYKGEFCTSNSSKIIIRRFIRQVCHPYTALLRSKQFFFPRENTYSKKVSVKQ